MACDSGTVVAAFAGGHLRWGPFRSEVLRCNTTDVKKFKESGNYKDNEIFNTLLNAVYALERDKESLSMINHQFKAKCENQRGCWQHIKTVISRRAEKAEPLVQDLIIRVVECKGKLNSHF